MHERRCEQRLSPHKEIIVYDRESCEPLGAVVNMSKGGFMLSSEEACETDSAQRCFIVLPEIMHGVVHLEFGAVCKWCLHHEETGRYRSGHVFENLSDPDREIIENMLVSWFTEPEEPVAR